VKALGTRIRALRQSQGLGLAELAAAAGISKGYLSELERTEDANPTLDVLKRIADTLHVALADLLAAPKATPKLMSVDLPEGLGEFAREREAAGRALEPHDMLWLANAQYRGRRPRTKDDFAFLYRSLRESAKDDDEEGK
jgi:transcriptional regulator with XRE-family HTH domain